MPVYEVQDAKGRTLEIEGENEPNAEDLSKIFSSAFPGPDVDAIQRKAWNPVPAPSTVAGAGAGGLALPMGEQGPTLAEKPAPSPTEIAQPPSQAEQIKEWEQRPDVQAQTKFLETPLVNLPKELYTAPILAWLAPDIAEGMASGTKRAVESMTSPTGLATVPWMAVGGAEAAALKGASIAGRVIAGAFGVQGISQLPDAGKRYVEKIKAGDRQGAAEAWVDLAASAVQSLGVAGAMGLKEALSKPTPVEAVPPVIDTSILPGATGTFSELVPESRRLMAPRTRMPEFTESTLEPGGPPLKALPAPGEATGDILLPESPLGPRTSGYRISLPVEPEAAKLARQQWSKPIDVEAQVEGADALRQLASVTDETKSPGEPYQPSSVNVDLRQLERAMQKNTVSKVESWADEVIQDRLKNASSNPFLDPELLAAAAVKGAILFKKGVTTVAEWNKQMREQFGMGINDSLPKIYEQSKQYWESRSETPSEFVKPASEIGSGKITGVGGAAQNEFPTEPPKISTATEAALGKLSSVREGIKDWWKNRDAREQMTVDRDAGDNAAGLFGREMANDIRGDLRRMFDKDQEQAEKSLSFVIEAKGDYDALEAMRQKLIDSERADPHWRKEAVDAIDWAKYHWEELEPLAERYNAITDSQVGAENAAGIDTLKRRGYVMHAQDVDERVLGGGGEPTAFKKVRTFDTFADSIAAGIDPKSLNSVDLLQSRVTSGQRMINSRAWLEGLKGLNDSEGNPIATDLVKVQRADGSTYQEAPKGYHMETMGRTPIAIRDGFRGIFSALTDPSWFSRNPTMQLLREVSGLGKSLVLAVDTFHLGRIAFWDSLIKSLGIKTFKAPLPSYKKGVTLLDMSVDEIKKMASSGEVPKEWVPELLEEKRQLNLAVDTGFNVGRISDALYNDIIHSIPWLGDFNKFLFDQFQRGAMAESWLLEFERIRKARPEIDEAEAARQVSKDLNTRFGNLGRQGILKSKTASDIARLLALAPQWNEGLIRSELGALKQAGQFVADTTQGKRLYAGILMRSVGGMVVAQFVANQIINYATRGHPTWENPEEGVGAKLSAWIPDFVGKGPGFFLHPLGLAAETIHLLLNAYERTGDFQKTLNQYIRSRASVAMRPILTFITNTDFLGHTLAPGAVWKEIGKESVPLPIGASGYGSAAKQLITGKESEQFPGQIQKQIMSSVGVKTESAPSPGQRISKLAEEYNKEHGVERPAWQGPVGDYTPLTAALRIGNMDTAKEEVAKLLEKHKASEIANHFQTWPRAAFTGRRAQEGGFVKSLSPEQRKTYDKARQDRVEVAKKALILLREELTKKQQEERK